MKRFFEYFFYRIAKLNFKKDYILAAMSVTGVQFIILLNFYLFIISSFDTIGKGSGNETLIISILFFALAFYNYRLYDGKYRVFDERWKNESKKKKIVGMIIVILFIILSCSLFFVNGLIFHRFK
jgi:hypothetical protein